MKVLVIDNEEFLAENLCNYIRKFGAIKIQYVTSVKEALAVITQQKFDLIVSDLKLSNCQNDDWLLEIGSISPAQKLIIISSHPIPERIKSAKTLTILAYFEKPFDVAQLVNVIHKHFGKEVREDK